MSQHPRLGVSLRTRTRTLGTFNVAVALLGRSTGWGRGGRPRRTFVGYHSANRAGGHHFVELVVWRGARHDVVWSRRFDLDARTVA